MNSRQIIIGALSGWKYNDRRQRCLATWLADCAELGVRAVFLLGCPAATVPEQIGPHALALPCPDDYSSLPQKTLWFARWALEQPDWDYLFKCDDDTYVSLPRLLAFDPAGRDYIGNEWKAGINYGSGGAGYFLSRRAAKQVAEHLDKDAGAEDLLVGHVVRDGGMQLSIDSRLIPFGSNERRPRRGNDLITLHGVDAATFLAAHADAGLYAS